ncbi:hypothetical protein NL676_024368 [Syzygium grande]|nr:hypothetical protein NL676_024368 [Syzygium grande]
MAERRRGDDSLLSDSLPMHCVWNACLQCIRAAADSARSSFRRVKGCPVDPESWAIIPLPHKFQGHHHVVRQHHHRNNDTFGDLNPFHLADATISSESASWGSSRSLKSVRQGRMALVTARRLSTRIWLTLIEIRGGSFW